MKPNLDLYTAADGAKEISCSAMTVKRIAADLRLNLLRTKGGIRLFSQQNVDAIKAEWQRRTGN